MILRLVVMLLAVVPFVGPLNAGVWETVAGHFSKASNRQPTIKPLLVHDKIGVILEVKGKYKIVDPHTGKHISTRFTGKRKFIQATKEGLKWGEEFPGVHQLLIVPDEKLTTTIVDGIEYPGLIFVYDVDGMISVVNQVPVEQFLSHSLSQYQKQQMPEEALAAVVIAARTTAYYYAENPKTEYWSVEAQQLGYQGVAVEATGALKNEIQGTRFMVMSTSTVGDERIRAFPATWKGEPQKGDTVVSQITLAQAIDFANKGENAAQILSKAFPGIHIELMQYLD